MDYAHPHCSNRLFEWTMALIQFALGVWLFVFPTAIASSSFRFINDTLSSFNLMAFFLLIGGFRIIALIANGHWRIWGARFRALMSWAGAAVWLQMGVALAMLIPNVGTPPSPGIAVYFGLAVAEIISTYRARVDGNRHI